MKKMRQAAEKRLGASYAEKARNRNLCWKLLNRLRSPSTSVAIDSETLLEHFEGIFFDRDEPLFFDLATLGIPRPVDFLPTQFSDVELVAALKKLNSQAAVGPQRISSAYIKSTFSTPESRVPLLQLMNRCFFEGKVPAAWGISEVFVLYKGKGDKKLPVNYRGINLNNDFLRLFERLLDARFTSWLAVEKPWGNQQFGFCSGVGTEDAALCLQTLAGLCAHVKGFPLFANFIDLQRAFPSMLRTQILKILHTVGVPHELVRAFAATFSGNSCRLRIGNSLTRSFPVNRGTKEGGINSPKIFNTVYATALNRLRVHEFPCEINQISQHSVYYLVFADDLVLLSGDTSRLQEVSNALTGALAPLGMTVNAGKTKWLAFLPEKISSSFVPYYPSLKLNGVSLENVESFRYLGFDFDWDLSKETHRDRREGLQSLAARLMGRLFRRLEVTNFKSLRAYYMTLVRSQLYSFAFSTFSEVEYERAQKIFIQNVFSLPASFPIHTSCFFLRIPSYAESLFEARVKFFSRLASSGSISSLAALVLDREELLPLRIGWNYELDQEVGKLLCIDDTDFTDLEEVADLRSKLVCEMRAQRVRCFEASASAFVLDFFPSAQISEEFASFLGNLPHEAVRILLIFFSNQFHYSYLRSTNTACPFCSGHLSSSHLFLCHHTPAPYNNWSALVVEFKEGKYWEAVDRIFLTLQRWAATCRKFTPGFEEKVMEYFQTTATLATSRRGLTL